MKRITPLTLLIILSLTIFSVSCKEEKIEKKSTEKTVKKDIFKEVRLVKPFKLSRSITIKEGVTLQAEEKGAVTAEVGGALLKWHVKEHQSVKKGQPVATLDATDMRLRLAEAKGGRAALEAQLAGVKKSYDRIKSLKELQSVPEQDFDTLEAQYNALTSQLEAADSGIKLLKRMINKSTVRAPFSGVITKKKLPLGYKVLIMMPDSGDLAFIEKNDRLKISMNISELFFNEIGAATEIDFFIPTLNKTVKSKIDSKGSTINEMKKFNILSYIDNSKKELPSGIFAEATIKTAEKERVVVPAMAVKIKSGREAEVYSVKDGKVTANKVYTGFAFEEGIEITGDIPEFVIKDVSSVTVGEKVKVTN